MKTMKLLFTLLFVAVTATGFGQITGSAHDFSGSSWSGGEICIACHTPHNADVSVAQSPLWNHEVTTETYTVYSSPTLDAGILGQPSGHSKLCLSCHDGTVALDSYGGATGSVLIANGFNVNRGSASLTDDHPISFAYDATLYGNDDGLRDPANFVTLLGGTIENDLLIDGQLECSSCHDVHRAATTIDYLLKIDNSGSALCLTCHAK